MEILETLGKILLLDPPVNSMEEIALSLLDRVEKKETDSFQEFFDCVEQEFIFGDEKTQNLILIGLLESLKNHASMRDVDYAIFENWLGPETHIGWRWLEKRWKGKTSLADTASGL
jgi:hypothetical protein